MPLDGRHYEGVLPGIAPAAYHPRAPLTAEVPAGVLSQAYQAMRWRARLMGRQSYPLFARGGVSPPITTAGSWADLALFEKFVPVVATHARARILWSVASGGDNVVIHTRIIAEVPGGGTQDVGESHTVDREATRLKGTGEEPSRFSLFDHRASRVSVSDPFVMLSNVVPSLGAPLRVRVQAFATENGQARSIAPHLVEVHWAAIG